MDKRIKIQIFSWKYTDADNEKLSAIGLRHLQRLAVNDLQALGEVVGKILSTGLNVLVRGSKKRDNFVIFTHAYRNFGQS